MGRGGCRLTHSGPEGPAVDRTRLHGKAYPAGAVHKTSGGPRTQAGFPKAPGIDPYLPERGHNRTTGWAGWAETGRKKKLLGCVPMPPWSRLS